MLAIYRLQSHHNDVDLLSFPWFFTTIQQSSEMLWMGGMKLISQNFKIQLISIQIGLLDFTHMIRV